MRFGSFLSTTSKERHSKRQSEIYTKHTTHEPCIHSKNHRRRRWDGCPFGARPPAPRRHHVPTNISREATARPGRPGTPGAPDSSQTRGAIKRATPPLTFLRPTIHNFASQDELYPQKPPNADIRHTKRSQKPPILMIFHLQLLNCVNT